MSLQTISSTSAQNGQLPEQISVKRSDPVYNAHSYLTKVPLPAIEPFIEAFTKPGDMVLDLFAGSGMTGVAAAILGRRAILSDISVLGRHIGRNYVNLVDSEQLRAATAQVVAGAKKRLGDVYGVCCSTCSKRAVLSKRVWSVLVKCRRCDSVVNYYASLEAAQWNKAKMCCGTCGEAITLRKADRVGEEPAVDTVVCSCSTTMLDQAPTPALTTPSLGGLWWPQVSIGSDRQMYQSSALGKHGLGSIASFFSDRNLAVLAALREQIMAVPLEHIREKLLFAFTAILARASKRYQWSRQRPLNAANQNYYIAPVYYEWNVFDLFERKVEAIVRSDDFIRARSGGPLFAALQDVQYRLGSADRLDLDDASVDYVFTDPPFGSNIFYSDMNLFQEAWLGELTDFGSEAVVDRAGHGQARRTAERYESLLTGALRECHRVLKADGHLSLVFSNSDGEIWALLQRAIREAGFVLEDHGTTLLDKGQRSVKGLASGFEDVVTVDLVLTMRKQRTEEATSIPAQSPDLNEVLDQILDATNYLSPSQVYLRVVRHCLRHHWDLSPINFSVVSRALEARGFHMDLKTGRYQ